MAELSVGGFKIGTNGISLDPAKAAAAAAKLASGRLDIRLGIASDDARKFEEALAKAGFNGFDNGAPDNKFTQKEKDNLLKFIAAHPELDSEIMIKGLDMTVNKKALEMLDKIAQQGQGQAPAQAAAAPSLTVRPGEASELAANVEKYMQEAKLPVKPNGTLSAAEAEVFKKHIPELEKKTPALKGQITFDAEGNITFTQKALGLLDIDAPKGAAPAAQAPATAPAPEPAASAVGDSERVKKLARDAVDGNVVEKFKANNNLSRVCGKPEDPDFNSNVCQDYRAKKDPKGRQ